MTDAPPPGWEGILEPGERVLWQGQPTQGLRFDTRTSHTIMGLVVTAFAIGWTIVAARATWDQGLPSAALPLFGLYFIYQGLGKAGGFALWRAYVHSRTWYTLTDRRAFIATHVLGQRRLNDWRVAEFGEIVHDYGPPPCVWFAEAPRGKNRRIGFRDIDEAYTVMSLLRDLQKGDPV